MTYSLSITGVGATQKFAVKEITVDDASAGQVGSQALAMQTGLSFLGKGPDGQQYRFRIDAERSTPGNLVLLRV